MEATPKALNPELLQGQTPETGYEPDFMNSDSLPLNGVEAVALQGPTLQSVNEPDFELQGRTLQSGEQDGGFSIREKVEKVKGKLAVLAIGAAGLGFGGMATASANGNGEQVGSGAEISNTNTGNEAEAPLGPNALRKMCKAEILKMPKIIEAKVYRPGKRWPSRRVQNINIYGYNEAIPKNCNGKYLRQNEAKVQLQNPKNHRRWFRSEAARTWVNIGVTWGDGMNPLDANKAGDVGMGIMSNGHEGKNVYYQCTPGKRKTKVRAFYRNTVIDLQKQGKYRKPGQGKIIAKKVIKRPVEIEGGGC